MKVKKVLLASFLVLSLALPPIQPGSRAYAHDTVEYWAVIVGVADYKHISDLTYADDDAQDLYNKLRPIWGADHIKLLVDSEATKADVENAISSWLDPREDANDVVLFFFSGHGRESSLHEYICAHDSDISDNVLDSWLDNLESPKQVVILDSCHSGGFIGELSQPERVILTACGKDESSWSYPVLEHSLFSYYILEAFSDLEAVNNGDDKISVEEIFNYVKPKVVSYYYEYPQHPELYDGYSGEIGLFNVGTVTFDASPQVASITIDGTEYQPKDLPITFVWVPGTTHTFSVSSSVLDEGTKCIFTSWSDGNTEVARTITISGGATYTANYEVPFTFDASPRVASIYIDGIEYQPEELPVTLTWLLGTTHTFSVSSSVSSGVRQYAFSLWSDGNTQTTRTIAATATTTYSASYKIDVLQTALANWFYILAAVVVLVGVVASVLLIKRRKKPPEEEIIP